MSRWIESLTDARQFTELFNVLPSVYFFTKDLNHRFQAVNQAFAETHGLSNPLEIVGMTDHDFHTPALASLYVEEDNKVMRSGRPLLNQIWLVIDHAGLPRWYLSSKFPLRNSSGKIAGIAGVMRPYHGVEAGHGTYARLTPALNRVVRDYSEKLSIPELAKSCNLSESQFQRQFQRCFKMTVGNYILSVRLLMARQRLSTSDAPVGAIALDCGFYDQSHFTRAFQKANGLSPRAFRDSIQSGVSRRSIFRKSPSPSEPKAARRKE